MSFYYFTSVMIDKNSTGTFHPLPADFEVFALGDKVNDDGTARWVRVKLVDQQSWQRIFYLDLRSKFSCLRSPCYDHRRMIEDGVDGEILPPQVITDQGAEALEYILRVKLPTVQGGDKENVHISFPMYLIAPDYNQEAKPLISSKFGDVWTCHKVERDSSVSGDVYMITGKTYVRKLSLRTELGRFWGEGGLRFPESAGDCFDPTNLENPLREIYAMMYLRECRRSLEHDGANYVATLEDCMYTNHFVFLVLPHYVKSTEEGDLFDGKASPIF